MTIKAAKERLKIVKDRLKKVQESIDQTLTAQQYAVGGTQKSHVSLQALEKHEKRLLDEKERLENFISREGNNKYCVLRRN